MAPPSKAATWVALAFLGGISLGRAQVSLTVEKNPSAEKVSYRLTNRGEQAVRPLLVSYARGAVLDRVDLEPIPPHQEEQLQITIHHDDAKGFSNAVRCRVGDQSGWKIDGGLTYFNPKTGDRIAVSPGLPPPPGYAVILTPPAPATGKAFDASGGGVLAVNRELVLCGGGEALPAGFAPAFQPTRTAISLTHGERPRALFVLQAVAIDPTAPFGTKLNTEK